MAARIAAGSGSGVADTSDITGRAVRSGVVQMGSQGVQVSLMIATGAVLARILEPRDFGLYAMANSLMMFVMTFRDLGISTAIVQRGTVDDSELSGLFWVNVRANLLIAAAIAISGPLLAAFYGEPELAAMTAVMACGSFVAGLSVQPEGLLMRRLRFGVINAIEIVTFSAGAAAAILLALAGWGRWALPIQFVIFSALRSLAIWLSAEWRPSRPRATGPGHTHHDMLSFGRNFSGFRAIDHVARHLGQILVGFTQGATAAGFYYNAYKWANYPVQQIFTPLQRVAVSGLSRLHSEPARFLASFSEGALLLTSVVLPLLAFFALEPAMVIRVLLGSKWLNATEVFRMLALASMAMTLTRLTLWINLSTGNSGRQFKWGIVRGSVLAAAALIGLQWGAIGVATAYAIASWVQTIPEILYCLTASIVRPRDFAAMIWRPVVSCSMAAAVVIVVGRLDPVTVEGLVALSERLAVFGVAYVGTWLIMPGGRRIASQLVRIAVLAFRER